MQLNQLDEISLQDLQIRCYVGIFPRERLEPQPISLQVSLYLDTRKAAKLSSLAHTVDYGSLAQELRFIMENARFRLLESAVDFIAHYILCSYRDPSEGAFVEAVRISIDKPKALPGSTIPRISVLRTQTEAQPRRLDLEGVDSFLYQSCRELALFKSLIAPESTITLKGSPNSFFIDCPLGEGLAVGEHAQVPFQAMERPAEGQTYRNTSCSNYLKLLTIMRVGEGEGMGNTSLNDDFRLFDSGEQETYLGCNNN